MTNTKSTINPETVHDVGPKTKPIEVWLTKKNLEVACTVVYEDETTASGISVDALSVRGAQREITGWLIRQGYEPADRWETETDDADSNEFCETVRHFRPAKSDSRGDE